MTTRVFFLERVNDHLQYFKHINHTLENEKCFQKNSKEDDCFRGTKDTECNLGRWLYGEGSVEIKAFKNSQIEALFRSLFEPHTRFHTVSKEAIFKRQAGDKEGAQAMIVKMKEISNLLTSQILELEALLQKEGFV